MSPTVFHIYFIGVDVGFLRSKKHSWDNYEGIVDTRPNLKVYLEELEGIVDGARYRSLDRTIKLIETRLITLWL